MHPQAPCYGGVYSIISNNDDYHLDTHNPSSSPVSNKEAVTKALKINDDNNMRHGHGLHEGKF